MPIAVGLMASTLVLVALVIVQGRRIRRLTRRLDSLSRGGDGRSLEALLASNLERVERVGREMDELGARVAGMEADLVHAVQRVGLVRFNPFEEMGGNQSFALALLDSRGDGFVISSLHGRTGTRIYGKALVGGRAETALSNEEREAVRLALESARRSPA